MSAPECAKILDDPAFGELESVLCAGDLDGQSGPCHVEYKKFFETKRLLSCGTELNVFVFFQGDSGSGLYRLGELAGIVSFGSSGCANSSIKNIANYVNVSHYASWIEDVILVFEALSTSSSKASLFLRKFQQALLFGLISCCVWLRNTYKSY